MQAFKSDFYQKYSLGIELLNLSNCTKSCCPVAVARAHYCPGQKFCAALLCALGRPRKHQFGMVRFVWCVFAVFATFLKHIHTLSTHHTFKQKLITTHICGWHILDFSLYFGGTFHMLVIFLPVMIAFWKLWHILYVSSWTIFGILLATFFGRAEVYLNNNEKPEWKLR